LILRLSGDPGSSSLSCGQEHRHRRNRTDVGAEDLKPLFNSRVETVLTLCGPSGPVVLLREGRLAEFREELVEAR
jgi:hypothetical protein